MEDNRDSVKELYRINLYDYAAPSFVTAYKSFYGTEQEIEAYLMAHLKDGVSPDIEVCKEKVSIHGYQEFTADNYEWIHANIWGSKYDFRCDNIKTQHYWISYDDSFKRIVSVWAVGLQFASDRVKEVGWIEIGNMFWGLPEMIIEGHNQLMVDEIAFPVFEAMQEDMRRFQKDPVPILTGFCDEILGDG